MLTGQDWKIAAKTFPVCVHFFVGENMENKIKKILLKESNKAYINGDVPVGALIVRKNKVLCHCHNTKQKKNKVIAHAEINCIIKAAKKLKTWHLNECELYVTLKPCKMCEEVIKSSQIKKVYYYLDKPIEKKEFYKTEFSIINDEISIKVKNQLKSFFTKKISKR